MTYKRDPRVAIGDTDYASAAGNPGDISNLTAGATSSFLQIIAGLPAWRTTVQATASLAVATQTLKGLMDAATFNKISAELINYVTNSNFQADTASSAAASWTATNATQICSTSGPIINTKSMRVSPSATLTGTVDGDLNTLDGWVNTGGTDKTLSLTFLSYGDTDYLDNEISFVVWNSTDSVEVAGTTSTIPLLAKYHKVSWVPATGKVYKLRFKTTVVAVTHRIFVDSFVCGFEQERAANTCLLGPASGTATVPTFRTIVGDDLAATPTATKVLTAAGTGNAPTWETPAAPSFPAQNANKIYAGPTSGGDATPTFRTIVNADFPSDIIGYNNLPNMSLSTVVGRLSSGSAQDDPQELSMTQLVGIMPDASGSVRGLMTIAGYNKLTAIDFATTVQIAAYANFNITANFDNIGAITVGAGTWLLTAYMVVNLEPSTALGLRAMFSTDNSTILDYSLRTIYLGSAVSTFTVMSISAVVVPTGSQQYLVSCKKIGTGTINIKSDSTDGYSVIQAFRLKA